jgi:transketolase
MASKATRDGFGDEILELGKEKANIYVIDCDISKSCKTTEYIKQFPEKHVNVGIAEQNAAGVAAGLAAMGKVPFISTYAVFGSMRMCEQIRQSVCYPHLNVKIACSHGGLTPANDGASHQAIEDMGIYRTIPNMTVIMPADYNATRKLVRAAYDYYGPVYLRFTRDPIPMIYNEEEEFEIGKGKLIKEGSQVSIIAVGDVLHQALEATMELEKKGISVELIDMFTIKPLDKALVLKTLEKTKRIITVEDHSIYNGLGSAVAEVVASAGKGVLEVLGIKDRFGESAAYYDLLKKHGIDAGSIIKAAENILQREI